MKRASLVIVAALLCLTFPAGARAEDGGSNIPGTDWVGPSVTSTAGGPFVDRVWRLVLTEGRVAMIRLAGDSGAELGLYLFDQYAQSILLDDPLKSSAKEGGTQSIVASLPAGTYYVNVNGRNTDRARGFTLSISLFADLTPAELFPRVASGIARVSGSSVEILPQAYDALSGVAAVRYRLQGGVWGDWTTSTERVWVTLPQAEGPYIVELQAKNGVDLVSDTAQVSVVVDRTPPTAAPVDAATFVTSARPQIAYRFSEPMLVASIRSSLVVSDFTGARIDGSFSYVAANQTAVFTPTLPLELGKSYAVDLVGATDLAGNRAASPGGWTFTYLLSTSVKGSLSATSILAGGPLALRGTSSGVPTGSRVSIEWQPSGSSTWVAAGMALVRAGAFYSSLTPESSGAYRATYVGDATRAPSTSKTLKVSVRPALQLSGAGGYVRVRRSGTSVALRGYADPQGLPLVFARYRCNASFTSCVRAGGETVFAGSDGRATSTWVATKGYWGFRLKTAATAAFEPASTSLLKFRVP